MVWEQFLGFFSKAYRLRPVADLYGDTLSSYMPARSGDDATPKPPTTREDIPVKNQASNQPAQSVPASSGEIYHVTPARNLESIFRDGLVPLIGPRSAVLGETKAMVYFFGSMLAVETALTHWLGEALADEPGAISVLAVDRAGLHLIAEARFDLACPHQVPPTQITIAFRDNPPDLVADNQVIEGTS